MTKYPCKFFFCYVVWNGRVSSQMYTDAVKIPAYIADQNWEITESDFLYGSISQLSDRHPYTGPTEPANDTNSLK